MWGRQFSDDAEMNATIGAIASLVGLEVNGPAAEPNVSTSEMKPDVDAETSALLERYVRDQQQKNLSLPKFASETETERDENDSGDENEESEVEMTKEELERLDRELWKKKFPGGHPPYPVRTPEEEAYWAEWAESREARLELEKHTEAEGRQPEANVPTEASTSVSAKPVATPKEGGRSNEGDPNPDLKNRLIIKERLDRELWKKKF